MSDGRTAAPANPSGPASGNGVVESVRDAVYVADRLARTTKHRLAQRGKNPRSLPDFVGIGAIKGGSTALWYYLAQHPQVMPASEKQLRFFDYKWSSGPTWYRTQFPETQAIAGRSRALGLPVVTGEFSPSYLSDPWAYERAASVVPDAKLIVALRNPVDRAYSQWQMLRRDGFEPEADFDRALELENERISGMYDAIRQHPRLLSRDYGNRAYVTRGRYVEQIERWLSVFPREQLLVVHSERLSADPEGVLCDEVFPYLGIAASAEGIDLKKQRVGGYDETMSAATRARLTEYFAPYNARLESLLGVSFGWD